MAFDGTLKFDTAIDKTGFKLGLDSLGGLAKKGMSIVTASVGAASAAVTALGGYAADVGKDFESSMAQVIATMGITKDTVQDGVISYDLLKEAAAAAGESTTFSASEAADALNYLALAGYDATKAADALPAVLDLAAAGGLDLAYASDLATDAMAALGIEATSGNLTRFGDEMAKTASKANTSVSQLGEAILTVGGTAKSLAGGTAELNASLGVLANRGIKGAEGGTALRNVILALSAPTDKAAESLDRLGVQAFDAEGNLRPLNEVFKDLDSALSGMSEGEKTQVLNEIFNKVDLKSAQALLAGCGSEFTQLSEDISNCDGAMSDMAFTMNDTLEGDLKSLSSKAEAFGISIYEGLNEPLRELAVKGGEYISQLTNAFKEGGFDGLAEGLGSVIADAVTDIAEYVPKVADIGVSVIHSLAKGLTENAPAIAESLTSALSLLITGVLSVSSDMIELGEVLILSLLSGISAELPTILDSAISLIDTLSDGILSLLPQLIPIAVEIVQTLATALSDNLPEIIPKLYGIIEVLTAPDLIPAILEAAVMIISALLDGFISAAPIVYDYIPQIIENVIDLILILVPQLCEAGVMLIDQLAYGMATIAPKLIDSTKEMLDNFGELFADGWNEIENSISEAWESFKDAFSDGWNEIGNSISEAWQSFKEAVSDGWNEIKNMFSSAFESIKQWFSDSVDNAKQSAAEFVTGAMTFLNELPGKLGEMLGNAIGEVAKWAVEAPQKAKEAASEFLENVREFISQLPSVAKEYLDTMISKVKEWALEIISKSKNAAAEFLENVKEYICQLPSAVKEHLDSTISKVKEWADDLKNKAKEAAKDLVDEITAKIGELPSKMADTGRNLVEGLWNGITGAGDWLKGKISDFGSGIIDGFKESFGIHSPSTVMRDRVGKYLAQGVGAGFTAEMPIVRKTAVHETQKLIPDITAVKAFSANSGTVDTITAQPSATSIINNYNNYSNFSTTNSGNNIQSVTLHAHFAVGEEVVAEGVKEIMVNEIDKQQGVDIQLKKRGLTT